MKKNIAIIIPSLSGGGAERVASVLSQYFSIKNNVFLFLEKYDRRTAYPNSGKIIYTLPASNSDDKQEQIKSLINRSIEMKKLKKLYKIDVAISFMEESNFVNILSKGKEKVIARVCTILSERKDEFKNKIVYNPKILHLVYNRSDKIIVMSKYAKSDLIQNWKVKKNRICIIENPMNFEYISSKKDEEVDWKYGDKVLVSVNRLDYVKRQWHIIKAFSEVIKILPDAKLLFIGDGECKNRLNVLVKKYSLENSVIFLGHQNNVYPYMKKSKGYVLTSKTEGFPNSMLEALYVGTPVISLDCPGASKEILAGKYIRKKTDRLRYLKYGVIVPDIPDCKDDDICYEEKILAEAMINVLSKEKIQKYYYNCAKTYINKFEKTFIGSKWDSLIEE